MRLHIDNTCEMARPRDVNVILHSPEVEVEQRGPTEKPRRKWNNNRHLLCPNPFFQGKIY